MIFARLALFIFSVSQITLLNTAHAGSRAICDRLLSSSSLTSVSVESSEQLSPSAKSYVNMIQLYISKVEAELGHEVINKILSSDQLVNPFIDRRDSISIQLSSAMAKLKTQLKPEDLTQIKLALSKIVQKTEIQKKDRDEKEARSAIIFKPKYIDTILASEQVWSAPAWQTIDGRSFLVVPSTDNLSLYEMIDEKLKLIDAQKVIVRHAPVWQVVNGRTLLAFFGDDLKLYVYEFLNDKLKRISSHIIREGATTEPSWQIVGDKVFLAINSSDDFKLNLFELANDKLIRRSSIEMGHSSEGVPAWQTVNGQTYIAVGAQDFNIHLYEVVGTTLKRRDAKEHDAESGAAVWHSVNGRVFVAIGSYDERVYLYELVNGKLVLRDDQEGLGWITGTPAWITVGKKVFVVAGTHTNNFHVYELIGDSLQSRGVYESKGGVASARWQIIDDRVFLVIGEHDTYFYELIDGQLIFQAKLNVGSSNHISGWHIVDGQAYVASGSANQNIYLIKAFETLTKQK